MAYLNITIKTHVKKINIYVNVDGIENGDQEWLRDESDDMWSSDSSNGRNGGMRGRGKGRNGMRKTSRTRPGW